MSRRAIPEEARVPSDHEAPTAPVKPEHEARLLVVGMLAAPLAWLAHLGTSYALVQTTCERGISWPHHAAAAIALALALPGGWSAWKEWRSTPKDEERAPRERHRTHFLAIAGIVNSAFFSAIIILAWAAAFAISPCDTPP